MTPRGPAGNRYDAAEWAGAFGDLGTLLPFVMAYLAIVKLDAAGVLLGFGVSMIACGWYYKTPFPVQPMKAAGAAATAQAAQVAMTSGAVHAAGLVTGLIWLLVGATGIAERLGRWVSRPVVQGVMLGLGAALVLQGAVLMRQQWLLAALGLALVVVLARLRRFPSLFALLILGLGWTAWRRPEALPALATIGVEWRWPAFAWPAISAHDLVVGTVVLALPQAPLTLGNAIIGIRTENNRLFPQRSVSDRAVALSTGWMNLFGSAVGAVPMCHGAGGMAGHVAFGARTGGSVVILGSLLLVLALGFSHSVMTLFGLVPMALLGTILFVTGWQLGAGQIRQPRAAGEWLLLLATASVSVWNVAAGLAAGLLLQHLLPRRKPAGAR
jgi:MFS superfamily sulfate permease-like transporter